MCGTPQLQYPLITAISNLFIFGVTYFNFITNVHWKATHFQIQLGYLIVWLAGVNNSFSNIKAR